MPISPPYVTQLLGRSSDGELVFEKFTPCHALALVHSPADHKTWILRIIISSLKLLHSVGVIQRDLRIDNLVFSSDTSRVLICDLEGWWGNRLVPQISRKRVLDTGWTEKPDIYDPGYVIKGMLYGNIPIKNLLEWPIPPPPPDAIVEACTRNVPDERPSLDELCTLVDKIEV